MEINFNVLIGRDVRGVRRIFFLALLRDMIIIGWDQGCVFIIMVVIIADCCNNISFRSIKLRHVYFLFFFSNVDDYRVLILHERV